MFHMKAQEYVWNFSREIRKWRICILRNSTDEAQFHKGRTRNVLSRGSIYFSAPRKKPSKMEFNYEKKTVFKWTCYITFPFKLNKRRHFCCCLCTLGQSCVCKRHITMQSSIAIDLSTPAKEWFLSVSCFLVYFLKYVFYLENTIQQCAHRLPSVFISLHNLSKVINCMIISIILLIFLSTRIDVKILLQKSSKVNVHEELMRIAEIGCAH